jgi:excisionase family DNA binding protein
VTDGEAGLVGLSGNERPDLMAQGIRWLSTKEASARLGVTLRSLYRFIDEGALRAYRFGRVIRLMESDIDTFIQSRRIEPGSLEHLYPARKGAGADG